MVSTQNLLVGLTVEGFFEILDKKLDEKLNEFKDKTSDTEDLPRWMTRHEVKKYCRWRSIATVDNYARRGLLTKHYVGGVPRFDRDEVMQLFNSLNKK